MEQQTAGRLADAKLRTDRTANKAKLCDSMTYNKGALDNLIFLASETPLVEIMAW